MKRRSQMPERLKPGFDNERKARDVDEQRQLTERQHQLREMEGRNEAQKAAYQEKEREERERAVRRAEEVEERTRLETMQRELEEQRRVKEQVEKEKREQEDEARERIRCAEEAEAAARVAEMERMRTAEEAEGRARKAEERARELEIAAMEAEQLAAEAEQAAQAAMEIEDLLLADIDAPDLDEIIERERALDEQAMMDTFVDIGDDDLSADIDAELAELEAEGMRRYHAKLNEDTEDILALVVRELEGGQADKRPQVQPSSAKHDVIDDALKEVEERRTRLQWLPASKVGLVDALEQERRSGNAVSRVQTQGRSAITGNHDTTSVDDDALFNMIDDALVDDVRNKMSK